MAVIRIVASLIHAILQVIASVLVSGIGLFVTALTILLVAATLCSGCFSGFEIFHRIRKRKDPPNTDNPS